MADITMCKGKGCELAKTCYRHTSKASGFSQSYFLGSPLSRRWGLVNIIIKKLILTKP